MLVRNRSFVRLASLSIVWLIAPGSESTGWTNPFLASMLVGGSQSQPSESSSEKPEPKPSPTPAPNPKSAGNDRKPDETKLPRGPIGGKSSIPRAAGKTVVAADIGLRAYETVQTEAAYSAGEITQQDREISHVKNLAGAGGGMTGAAAGATTAAYIAAPIALASGPFAPIVEGGAIFAGGAVGYYAGEKAVSTVAEKGVRVIHNTGNTISSAASETWNTATSPVRSAWNWAWGK